MTTPRIAVIGAGPGGLLCARVLQRHGIEVAVYDADAAVHARDAGGTLDLKADSGQIALEDAGLLAEFRALARPEGQAKSRLDQHGTVLSAYVPEEHDEAANEIDRGQLRAMLAEQLAAGTVRWGHKLRTTTPLGDGVHCLEFADGAVTEVDLLVGADGAWSRVRPLLTDATPDYLGVSFLDVRFDDVDDRHPRIAKLVGDGHMFATDNAGRAIIGQRNSNGHVRGYVAMRTDLDWHAGLDIEDRAAVQRFLRKEFTGWSDDLMPFITDSDGPFVNRAIHALPAPLVWQHRPGVTLLGDAAHVMSPWGGFGVNLAMLDGAELARAIAEESTHDEAVIRYETVMFPRAGEHAVGANAAMKRFFATKAFDPADIPDTEAEHRNSIAAAAEYRRRNPIGAQEGPNTLWTLRFRTPGEEKQLALVLDTTAATPTGTLDGAPIENCQLAGRDLRFTARITAPFKMKITCTATINADTMTGTAKAAMMSIAFTGTRTTST
jgi:2-polyprenyl-6-methoxyphenol hydroxylase-like FAD-dependent oxidoreductase